MQNSYQGTYNHTQNTHSQDQHHSQDHHTRRNVGTEHETSIMEKNLLNNLEELVGAEDSKQDRVNNSIFSNNMFAQ